MRVGRNSRSRARYARIAAFSVCAVLLCGCALDRGALARSKRSAGAGVGANAGVSGAFAGNGVLAGSGAAGTGLGNVDGGQLTGGDAGPDACGGCDDGVFCNGSERCQPGDPAADARGCVTTPACLPSQLCDDLAAACTTDCSINGGDADGDGFLAVACGGDDCNDASFLAYPGGVELCDGIDNDCEGGVDDGFAQFSCLSNNTLAMCVLGQCVIAVCSNGFEDCDRDPANGCETSLDPVAGDCLVSTCSGITTPDDQDTPADDGNDCTIEICAGGVPGVENASDGSTCNKKGSCNHGVCE